MTGVLGILQLALPFLAVHASLTAASEETCKADGRTGNEVELATKLLRKTEKLYSGASSQEEFYENMDNVAHLLRDVVDATSAPACAAEEYASFLAACHVQFALALLFRHNQDNGTHENEMVRSFEAAYSLNATDWVSAYFLGMFYFNAKTEPDVSDKLGKEHLERRRSQNWESPAEAHESRRWLRLSIEALRQLHTAGVPEKPAGRPPPQWDFGVLPLLVNPPVLGDVQRAPFSLLQLYESVLRYFGRAVEDEEQRWAHRAGVDCGLFASIYQRPSDPTMVAEGYTSQPFFDAGEEFPLAVNVLENPETVKALLAEGLAALRQSSSAYQAEDRGLHFQGAWKELTLFNSASRYDDNCAVVPKTCAVLERLPFATQFPMGQIKFSHMEPGTMAVAHCGPTNMKLRLHLGLLVPDDCGIVVGNETGTWTAGKALLFDDSFEHYVWNNASTDRLVLIVDLPHPRHPQTQDFMSSFNM